MTKNAIEEKQNVYSADTIRALNLGLFPLRYKLQLEGMQGPALDIAKKRLPLALKDDALIILAGEHGVGKTQIATWWAAQRVLYEKSNVRYEKTTTIISHVKLAWSKKGRVRDLIDTFVEFPFLVLDNYVQGTDEWETRMLVDLIDQRYNEMKCTIIICNCVCARVFVDEKIDASILDRAGETGGIVYCDWPSYRT